MGIKEKFDEACSKKRDIDQHLPYLLDMARKSNSVVEGGVRDVVSSWAFILGCACRGMPVTSYDVKGCSAVVDALEICRKENVVWNFVEQDWLIADVPECDLLFIDTKHTYTQLIQELRQLSGKSKRWIIMHDTTLFGTVSEDNSMPGLWDAVRLFLRENSRWRLADHRPYQNGLTTLERLR